MELEPKGRRFWHSFNWGQQIRQVGLLVFVGSGLWTPSGSSDYIDDMSLPGIEGTETGLSLCVYDRVSPVSYLFI